MTTGELLVGPRRDEAAGDAEPPDARTVDVVTKEATVSFKERTDVTAVPAMGVVAETMVAWSSPPRRMRKFGGDSLDRVRPQPRRLPRRLADDRRRDPGPLVLVGLMATGKTTVGRALAGAWAPVRRHRRHDRGPRPERRSPIFARAASRRSARSRPRRSPTRWRRPRRPSIAAAGGVVLVRRQPRPPAARAGDGSSWSWPTRADARSRAGRAAATTGRCSPTTRRARCTGCSRPRRTLYAEVADRSSTSTAAPVGGRRSSPRCSHRRR